MKNPSPLGTYALLETQKVLWIKPNKGLLTLSNFTLEFFAQFSKRNFGSIYVM